jgi:hypothetical protein
VADLAGNPTVLERCPAHVSAEMSPRLHAGATIDRSGQIPGECSPARKRGDKVRFSRKCLPDIAHIPYG